MRKSPIKQQSSVGGDWAITNQQQLLSLHGFAGMSVANDSPLEWLHVPRRVSDLQAKLEHYQMVVYEHQWCLQHMLNWQFEPLLYCQGSKSLTCNVHSGPWAHKKLLPSLPCDSYRPRRSQLWDLSFLSPVDSSVVPLRELLSPVTLF